MMVMETILGVNFRIRHIRDPYNDYFNRNGDREINT